jgi:HK97 family phage prohead protease
MNQKNFTAKLEIKAIDTESGIFEGYASVFGVQDSDGDVILKGAFADSLKEHEAKGTMPKMLWQHNFTIVIGKFLEVREDDRGLWVRGQFILEVQKGKEAYALMRAEAIEAMSVGFNIVESGNGDRGRVITKLDLWEISIVTWGANPEALVSSVKSISTERDFEKFLRDAGFSSKQAKRITAEGYKALDSRDGGSDDDELLQELKKLKQTIEG